MVPVKRNFNTLSIVLFALILFSCKNKIEYSYAVIESENIYNHEVLKRDSLIVDNKAELDTIVRALAILKKGNIIFPRSYIITLFNDKRQPWILEGNGFSLRDSTGSFFIPKGEIRDSYIQFLNGKFPKMKADTVTADVEH